MFGPGCLNWLFSAWKSDSSSIYIYILFLFSPRACKGNLQKLILSMVFLRLVSGMPPCFLNSLDKKRILRNFYACNQILRWIGLRKGQHIVNTLKKHAFFKYICFSNPFMGGSYRAGAPKKSHVIKIRTVKKQESPLMHSWVCVYVLCVYGILANMGSLKHASPPSLLLGLVFSSSVVL